MTTLPTFDELYAVGQAEVQSRNPLLTDWAEGSNNDAVIGGATAIGDEAIRVVVELFAAQFLDTATGDYLDALVADRYPAMDQRKPAKGAVVTLTFTRGGSTGVLTVPAGTTCKATVNGVSLLYATDVEAHMPGADDAVDVTATCTTTGRSGNVAEDTITTIVDTLPDDATATVTNADRAVGGDVEETDDALRSRARRYHTTLRKATTAALEVAALGVAGVSFATVDEANMGAEDGGYVSVYVGDPDARGNDALAALVDDALDGTRAAGIDVRVLAAEREEITLTMTLYVRKGSATAELVTAARAAVLAYTGALPPSATFYLSGALAAAKGVSSDVLGAHVDDPAADVVPALAYHAIRVNAADLSITPVEV
jgi:uncharacterized phage protein gp47/JayE